MRSRRKRAACRAIVTAIGNDGTRFASSPAVNRAACPASGKSATVAISTTISVTDKPAMRPRRINMLLGCKIEN